MERICSENDYCDNIPDRGRTYIHSAAITVCFVGLFPIINDAVDSNIRQFEPVVSDF